jgi:hypothetical protein
MRKGRSSELERRRRREDFVTTAACLTALIVPWLLLWHAAPDRWRRWYIHKGADLDTLLQVVPATVVAVFVFAVGAVFVMAQIIGPTLGSRAIEALLVRRRARACVIAGMVLLLACLALTALAHPLELWEVSAASSLALATLAYVPFSIWCISSVLQGFVSPSAYSTLLSKRQGWGRPLTSDRAFRRLRALRQWLRTACRVGESRDIVFALDGFQKLLGYYCDEARKLGNGKPLNETLRRDPPAEYSRTSEIVNSRWWPLLDPRGVRRNEMSPIGWFGDELGRALARCAEVGIRSGVLLRRDLDRLLVVLGGATLQLAGFRPPGNDRISSAEDPSLPEEAGFLLDRIAEIGMYAFQVDNTAYSDWFVRPALVLASLENKLEGLDARVNGPQLCESSPANGEHAHMQEHCLAARSLAAWCLVNYTFQHSKDGASTQGEPTAEGWRRLGEQARTNPQLWDEAKRLAVSPAMHPSWMPLDQDEPDRQQHLSRFIDRVQALVTAQPRRQDLAFADGLDWIIGGSYPAGPTVAHRRNGSATAADGVATLRFTIRRPLRRRLPRPGSRRR